MYSMNTRDFNPDADGLRDSKTAMTDAATVFNNSIEAKTIHCVLKERSPAPWIKIDGISPSGEFYYAVR